MDNDTNNNNCCQDNTCEQRTKVLQYINKKWTQSKICDVCGATNWQISEDTVSPVVMKGNPVRLGGTSYPQYMVICKECGNTKYFNSPLILAKVKEEEEKLYIITNICEIRKNKA